MNIWVLLAVRALLAGLGYEIGEGEVDLGLGADTQNHIAAALVALAMAAGSTFGTKKTT